MIAFDSVTIEEPLLQLPAEVNIEASQGPLVRYQLLSHPSATLVKQIELQADGSFLKKIGGQIPRGSTISTRTATLRNYVEEAFGGGVRQYILPANVELGTAIPISPKEFVAGDGVDRTASTLKYVEGPSVITFDHDPSPRSSVTLIGPAALQDIFVKMLPAIFTGAAWAGYASSSSNIHRPEGAEITGLKGFHLVFAVEDARKIKEFGERLFKRLWLQGYGYIHVSKNGGALARTIFDTKPLEAQQPLFSGGAHCIGCEQRRAEPIWHEGTYLNTAAMPALSPEEEREYKRLVQAAKLDAEPECERIRCEYLQQASEKLASEGGMRVDQARRIVELRLGGTLVGSDVLNFDDFGEVTVASVLADPEKYADATLADPVDGAEAGKAILYMNKESGCPLVFSQKHSGGLFFLKHDFASVSARLEKMDKGQALDEWASALLYAELRPDELERYFAAVKGKTGIGIGALRSTAKVLREPKATGFAELMQDPGLYLANLLLERKYQNGKTLIQLESGLFWHYTGTHWTPVKDSVLTGELQEVATEQWGHVCSMWNAFDKKPSTLASLVASALACLGGRVVMQGDPLRLKSARPSVINCANGELWLTDEGSDLRPHRAESYLTSCSAIKYDPEAKAPTYETAMRGILSLPGGEPMPDQDDMLRHIDELLGYSIQTHRNLKAFVMLVGPGDNGKTTFTKLMTSILGQDAIAYDRIAGVNEDGNRFATMRLVGKLVLIDDDVDYEYLLPDGLLKKIAEEKPLTGEAKFKDSFSFTAQVVPWLLGNSWPRSRDLSRGMQTRANVIYLGRGFLKPGECEEHHPDRQRPELWEKVYKEEMSGVLNRLIFACYRVAERKGFLPPESAKRAFDMWLREANVVARFIEDVCEKVDPAQGQCITSYAYSIFTMWCDANGIQQRHRPQLNNFGKRFEELGYLVKHVKIGTKIHGIQIKEDVVKDLHTRLPMHSG
jgi:P4 family phage/plasmid primase-like protien